MIYTQSQVVDYNMYVYLRINMFAFVGKQLFFFNYYFLFIYTRRLAYRKEKKNIHVALYFRTVQGSGSWP